MRISIATTFLLVAGASAAPMPSETTSTPLSTPWTDLLKALIGSTTSAAPKASGTSLPSEYSAWSGESTDPANLPSGQEPFDFPLKNGFPTPSPQEIDTIQLIAGGTLSDAPPPPFPGDDGITNLQLIAFNELFEVAFFTELLFNITTKQPGYELADQDFIIESLVAVQAQEELHALNANNALAHFNVTAIEPCSYIFPVDTFESAIALAGIFTDLVMGTLQDVQQIFAENNDAGLVRAIGSVIGQEGEQEGFFRILQLKRPSSAPFLTTSTRDFAFSALQSFVVPGSCPNEDEIDLLIFGALNVVNAADLTAKNGTAQFSVVSIPEGNFDSITSVVYISGQNLPVTVPVMNKNFDKDSSVGTFEASFPFEGGAGGVGAFNDGLTIAAAIGGSQAVFANADAVVNTTLFGPGLIEIN